MLCYNTMFRKNDIRRYLIKEPKVVDNKPVLKVKERKECSECRRSTNFRFVCGNDYCCNTSL